MKGIVIVGVSGGSYSFLPSGSAVDFSATSIDGKWFAGVSVQGGGRGNFGPAFATETEARELCRAAAVALAEGTGGVFGEVRPLKVGDQVQYAEEDSAEVKPEAPSGPKLGAVVFRKADGSAGVVTRVEDGAFDVSWTDRSAVSYPLQSFGGSFGLWRQP